MVHDELYTFHLFAGAGGGILGDLLLGHIPVGAVEIEKFPREVLFSRQKDGILPSFPIWDDVTTFRSDNEDCREYIDYLKSIREWLCICGGFPCQDISVAGKGLGVEKGKRSGLWSEMWRIIGEIRPHYIFVENSPALLARGFDRVVADLSSIRYDLVWGIVSAADTGAWHRRDRFWGLGIAQEWYGKGNAHPYSVLHGCRGGYGDNPISCTDPEGRTFRGVGLAYLVNHPEMYWGKEKYPTPIADDTGMRTKPYSQGGHALSLVVGQKKGLIDKVKWRTPKSEEHGDSCYNEQFAMNGKAFHPSGQPVELTLENQTRIRESENRVAGKENWRTPDCDEHGGQPASYLEQMAEGNFKRPTTGTMIQLTLADQVRHSGLYPAQSKEEEQGSIQKGQLSPDWTEWLMGWPVGWTDLKPLSPEAVARWKEAMLNGTYWAVDPADLPKDHPAYLPRLTEDKVNRANRLKAIGNGQVPMCVFVFETLAREFIHDRETAETDGQE